MKEILDNRYEVDFNKDIIGEGGMGRAYKIYDKLLEKESVLLIEKYFEGSGVLSLKDLAKFNERLRHNNILNFENFINISIDDEILSAGIREYSDIGSLNEWKKTNITDEEITRIFSDVLRGLEHIHYLSIVHRDIKPENILVFKDQHKNLVGKINDWNSLFSPHISKKNIVIGTPAFMDPNMVRNKIVNSSTDIWSFGATVYNFFTGLTPYPPKLAPFLKSVTDVPNLNFENIPDIFQKIVEKCLKINPLERPNATELLQLLGDSRTNFNVVPRVSKEDHSRTMMVSMAGFIPDIQNKESVDNWLESYDREKIKILFLAANPSKPHLSLDREIKKISSAIKMSKQRDKFIIHSAHAVSPDSLIQEILDFEPNIVHFSGHGNTDGIVLENQQEEEVLVSEKALTRLFTLFKSTVDCVVLNSCYSLEQAKAIKSIIPFVIGMNTSVPDITAITFSSGFYKGLGNGKSIEFSFELGLTNIELEGYAGDEIPVLLKEVK